LLDKRVLRSYELSDLRRNIVLGDESLMSALPSTLNLSGRAFQEMGSLFASVERVRFVIESKNHALGSVRTSRRIPQSINTVVIERAENRSGQIAYYSYLH